MVFASAKTILSSGWFVGRGRMVGSSCGGWAGRGVQRFLPFSRTANHRLKSETSSQNILLITEPIQHYSTRELKGEGIRLHLSRAADYDRITGKQECMVRRFVASEKRK